MKTRIIYNGMVFVPLYSPDDYLIELLERLGYDIIEISKANARELK